jgi:hypothetical protein
VRAPETASSQGGDAVGDQPTHRVLLHLTRELDLPKLRKVLNRILLLMRPPDSAAGVLPSGRRSSF